MHKNWWIAVGIIVVAAVAGIIMLNQAGNEDRAQAELDIKMDKYCTDSGGSVVNRSLGEGDIIKLCVFQDGSLCEEDALYINECFKGSGNCIYNEDCSADSCCHAKGCVAKTNEPECKGIMCTMNCEPGTLDCGQGRCECIGGKCEAVLNE